ncbi:MAG: tripartite tricarboxylate transporter substrate binding protein [Rhodocyclaceae bacterium]|nr:tripartite tricarboxylate transporter substrate binding protein [Rhodocyclaceae bacterium]
MKRFIQLLALCLSMIASEALYAEYPERPIKLIVPFAPGASADGIARIIGKKLEENLGKPVVVENKSGAGGTLGLVALAAATPDGYTLSMGATGAIVINPHVPDAPRLELDRHLAPLAKLADIPLVFISPSSSGIKSVQDLISQARTTPQGLQYGTPGQYTAQHLAGELLASMINSSMVAVPYRGSAPALTDILGGRLPAAVVDLTSAAGHIKAGTVIAVGVTSSARTKVAPEIPTLAESGVPGYSAPAWMGMFAPAKTPSGIMNRLSREIQAIMSNPDVQKQIIALAAEPAYLGADEFARFIENESKKWAALLASMPKPAK